MFAGRQRAALEALGAALVSQTGFAAVSDVVDVESLGSATRMRRVDVVVVEGAALGDDIGYKPVHDVLTADPHARVLIMGGEPDVVAWALCEGASGFVPAQAELAEVISAIRQVAQSGAWLDPTTQRRLLDRYQEVGPGFCSSAPGEGAGLTSREREILHLVSRGHTNAAVADECDISASTVKNHLASIFRKLGVSSRSHAIAVAFRQGILDRRL